MRNSTLTSLWVTMGTRTQEATVSPTASFHRSAYGIRRAPYSTSRTGVTIRTPIASPAHQADHTSQKLSPASLPVRTRTPAPTVALTSVAVRAPRNTRATPSRSLARSVRKPTLRSM